MALKHLPMTGKIALLIGALGAIMIAGTLLTGSMLRQIATDYSALINGPADAARSFAAADREIVVIERSILQNIWATSEANNAAFAAATVEGTRRFREALARTRGQVPDRAPQIDALGRRFDAVIAGSCTRTIAMANASTTLEGNAKAMAELNATCGPELGVLGKEVSAYADALGRATIDTATTLAGDAGIAVWRNYAFSFGGLVLALAAAIVMSRSGIVGPIRGIVAIMERMASGERDVAIPGTDRKDELGTIARTLDVFRVSLCEADALRSAQERTQIAEADRLAARNAVSERFVDRMMTITDGFVRSSEDVSGAANRLNATAAEATRGTQAVSGAATDASSNVQAVAAATEEMAASVREIAQQVNRALDIAGNAVSEAARTRADVQTLSQAIETVGGVVGFISDIAERTNLLALNATIEAARAGAAGRGFAVVAQEVKQLAAQTAKATEEITARIVQIQSAAGRAVASVEAITGTVETIREISGMIAGAVEEQGSATQEIAVNTQRAAQGASRVTGNIHTIGETVETTGDASMQLTSMSGDLTSRAADLRREIAAFVAELKAA